MAAKSDTHFPCVPSANHLTTKPCLTSISALTCPANWRGLMCDRVIKAPSFGITRTLTWATTRRLRAKRCSAASVWFRIGPKTTKSPATPTTPAAKPWPQSPVFAMPGGAGALDRLAGVVSRQASPSAAERFQTKPIRIPCSCAPSTIERTPKEPLPARTGNLRRAISSASMAG
jgi:hypothetical protein